MPIDLKILCRQLIPEETVLFFGAGSSIPSGGISGAELAQKMATHFKIGLDSNLLLTEISTVIEKRKSRAELISFIRTMIAPLKPTGSMINLPMYDWRSIYTTNYDTLIEQSYALKKKPLSVYRSNFDFQLRETVAANLYKLHGSIDQDVCDGSNSRIIITQSDYDDATQFKENLFDRFKIELSTANALIIGHSLGDPDLKIVIDEAIRRKRDAGAKGKITLLLYVKDEDRALILEERGIQVCYGGLDSFFAEIAITLPPTQLVLSISENPLDREPTLRPIAIDVSHAIGGSPPDVIKMYHGQPATYGDIAKGWTFEREIAIQLEAQLANDRERIASILGVAGVGKSTAARQALVRLTQRGIACWEHKDEFPLVAKCWQNIDRELRRRNQIGILLVDDCHSHIREVSRIADSLAAAPKSALKLLLVSTKHQWNPRLKSPAIFSLGKTYEFSQLSISEINSLLDLLDREPDVRGLVEERFLGFSRQERRRRLSDRCGADMFVCLKNIFGFEGIDNIILREYAELSDQYQDIYRTVSAMEAAGVRVHRQLMIRTLGIHAESIASIIDNMTDIITEYTISQKEGLYGWRTRHSVIADILTSYKYSDRQEVYELFERIIANLNPSYDLELRTIRSMCDMKAGIGKLRDRGKQNILLRRMISLAPGERVPRHRLISNLMDEGHLEEAETEIRLFEKELRVDPPVQRYKIKLLLRRAEYAKGIMTADRAALISRAATLAEYGINKFADDKNMYRSYLEIGVTSIRLTGNWDLFEDALLRIREAYDRIMDPDIARIIATYEGLGHRLKRLQQFDGYVQ